MGSLFGLIAIVLGIVNVVSPKTGWHMSEGWKFKDAEPSEAALMWARIGGVLCVLFGIWVIFTS